MSKFDIAQVVENLRNDNNYYGEYGAQFMSNSDVKALITDPSSFKQGMSDNENLIKGRLAHVLLFEPSKVSQFQISTASRRGTNQYKADLEAAGLEWMMLQGDFDEIAIAVKGVKENIELFEMMFPDGAMFEEPNVFPLMGLWWKTKADSLTSDTIYDFKTTGDLSRFRWAAKEYGYDSQAYLYQKSYGKKMVFVVGEKKTGRVGVFPCSDDFIESGYSKVKLAVENYNKYWNPKTKTREPQNYFTTEIL